jgi:hypothetical protein
MVDQPENDGRSPEETGATYLPQMSSRYAPASHRPGLSHLNERIFPCHKCGHILIRPE